MELVAAVLLVVVVAACQARLVEQGHENGVGVRNNTASILRFRELVDGQWYEFGSISPADETQLIDIAALTGATSLVGRDGCTIGVFVAFDPDGHEVARHEPGLCVGDIWQIDVAGASSSP